LRSDKRNAHALKDSLVFNLVAGNVNFILVKQCLGHKSIGSIIAYRATSNRQAAKRAIMAP
jgi:hypothetical protein